MKFWNLGEAPNYRAAPSAQLQVADDHKLLQLIRSLVFAHRPQMGRGIKTDLALVEKIGT